MNDDYKNEFTLMQNLELLLKVHFFEEDIEKEKERKKKKEEEQEEEGISILDFLSRAREICSPVQCQFLETILVNPLGGSLIIHQKEFKFQHNVIFGLRARTQPLLLCYVTSNNVEQIYHLYQSNRSLNVSEHQKEEIKNIFKTFIQIKQQVHMLQTQLAELTFDIVRSDQERFSYLKKRDKQLNRIKREIRQQKNPTPPLRGLDCSV